MYYEQTWINNEQHLDIVLLYRVKYKKKYKVTAFTEYIIYK